MGVLLVRAGALDEMWDLVERVTNIARGAALMADTSMERTQIASDANLVATPCCNRHSTLLRNLGAPDFGAIDDALAGEMQRTSSSADISATYGRFGLGPTRAEALSRAIYPLGAGSSSSCSILLRS